MKSYKLAKGIQENYIEVGNHFDKYNSKNPIVMYLINQFKNILFNFIKESNPKSIHEIGCGEGYWSIQLKLLGYNIKGSDFSVRVIELAKENSKHHGVNTSLFYQKSIYDLTEDDLANCIICCVKYWNI